MSNVIIVSAPHMHAFGLDILKDKLQPGIFLCEPFVEFE